MKGLRRYFYLILLITLVIFGAPAVQAADVRLIDVVSVTWQGAPSNRASVNDVERAITEDVNRSWRSFTTLQGDTRDRAISFQLGRTLATPITLNRPMACEGAASLGFMESIRPIAYERLGISDSKNRYLVILSADNGCIWSGRALIGSATKSGGTITMHDTASAFVLTHELGHTLGLGHSNFLRCSSGAFDGAWGGDCRAVEYGGTIDVMGNVPTESPLSTYHQWRLGLLEESEIKQSWLSEKIELNASDNFGGTRAIFIRDGKSTYWIEYRRAKESYGAGLAIYRTDPPPSSAIVSPNSADLESDFGDGVGTDIWMLNWDNYRYTGSRASGSMTLPQGRIATFFSNNVALSAEPIGSSGERVSVTINRKADTTPPAKPTLTDPASWSYPGERIIDGEYQDGESTIASYEALVDEKLVALEASEDDQWAATYLDPISKPKSLHLRDLPEGSYSLQVRAKDIWGNISPWSDKAQVSIDRGEPVATNEFRITAVEKDEVEVAWSGARDLGSGLCETIIFNEDGWVSQRSTEKSSPKFRFPLGKTSVANTQLYDCRGNGKSASISVSANITTADSRRGRTGSWSSAPKSYGTGALACSGKCSITFTAKGQQNLLIGDGAAEVYVSGRLALKVASSSSGQIRSSESFSAGAKNSVVRVQGRNFVLIGLSSLSTNLSEVKSNPKTSDIADPSLIDPIQKRLSSLGFRIGDFTSPWSVLPMARGTTLLDPTLDLCGNNYRSESGRELRRQLSVTKVGSPYLFLSTEVVKYRSKPLADAALAELKANFNACVKAGGGQENGTFTAYEFQQLPDSKARLVDESSRVLVRSTIGKGDSARQLLAFYQFRNEYFTGLYIVKAGQEPIANTEVLRWFDVAATMAERLSAGPVD